MKQRRGRQKARRIPRMSVPDLPATRASLGMEPVWHEEKGRRAQEAGRRQRQAARGQLRAANGLVSMVRP